jgi:hypothetical protein
MFAAYSKSSKSEQANRPLSEKEENPLENESCKSKEDKSATINIEKIPNERFEKVLEISSDEESSSEIEKEREKKKSK